MSEVNRDLEYHKRCRILCNKCGWVLYGSDTGGGFAAYIDKEQERRVEISQPVMDKLEELFRQVETLTIELQDWRARAACPTDYS